ncbi:type VI secretion lipoprotein TssJ [Paraburkholderia hayleyella]|uniref:type VI secretion lipoprotein TssJ n=1 Tax=Paraburkholderia hayleyella TaxID=2152889 RepID=UPI0015811406|nr:type VI secretion lipoprotein TssJ [Paraburkholderia hayleyella]
MRLPAGAMLALTLATTLLLGGCGAVNGMLGGNSETKALSQLKWAYAADGLKIVWQADAHLNEAEGQPHALALVAVQMEDPAAFTAYAGATDKLAELLAASVPPPGFLSLTPFFVQPGAQGSITLPRMEKAQYVGIVAGYYGFDPARIVRLYRIGVQVDTHGWVVKTRSAAPVPLQVTLVLGRDGLDGTQQGIAAKPPALTKPPAAGEVPLPTGAPAAPVVAPALPGAPGAPAVPAPAAPVPAVPAPPEAAPPEAAVKAGSDWPGVSALGEIPGLGTGVEAEAKKALQK